MFLYPLFKSILFQMSPEAAHSVTMQSLKKIPLLINTFGGKVKGEEKLAKTVAGLHFANPVGMAAGFDKNAHYLKELKGLGFGFAEIGTVTPKPQKGNPQPRLFRLPTDKALINRMGFNNDGADVIAKRLESRPADFIVGGNIGKNKATPNEEAVSDYLYCFERLYDQVDYFVLNVSSPNTAGLRERQQKDALRRLFNGIQEKNMARGTLKPMFVKIAPGLSHLELDDIIRTAYEYKFSGIIATNTTTDRLGLKTNGRTVSAIGAGGLSGLPLKQNSIDTLKYIKATMPKGMVIINSGGIMSAEDAVERMKLGSDLIELYTGFIYNGPGIIKEIKKALISANLK
jgi:dihydroorotate dehydrogenase